MKQETVNRAMYIAWLRQNFPLLYQEAIRPVVSRAKFRGMSGFFDTLTSGFKSVVSSVAKSLPDLAKTYTEYDLQRRLIKENTARARAGEVPLSLGPEGQLMPVTVPYTQADLMLAQQANTGIDDKTLLLLGGGLVLVLLVTSGRR